GTRYHTILTQINSSSALRTSFFVLPGVCKKRIIWVGTPNQKISRYIDYINRYNERSAIPTFFSVPRCLGDEKPFYPKIPNLTRKYNAATPSFQVIFLPSS